MLSYIFWIFVFYLLYRFIFGFLLPVSRSAAQMRQKVQAFQRQQEPAQTQDTYHHTSTEAKENPPAKEGEYIDFEEIK